MLPAALLATAVVQAFFLGAYPEWAGRLAPVIIGGSVVAALALVLARAVARIGRVAAVAGVAAAIGLAAILVSPAAWSAITVANAHGQMLPRAGPLPEARDAVGAPGGGGGQAFPIGIGPGADPRDEVDRVLLAYLLENRGGARFLFATGSSATASPYIIETGLPVMAMGGFGGGDPILTADEVAELVARGDVRFFLLEDLGAPPPGTDGGAAPGGVAQPPAGPQDEVGDWVRENCDAVEPAEYGGEHAARGGSSGGIGPGGDGLPRPMLYDCG